MTPPRLQSAGDGKYIWDQADSYRREEDEKKEKTFHGVCEKYSISLPVRGPPGEKTFHRHRGIRAV